MKSSLRFFCTLFCMSVFLPCFLNAQEPWSGIISTARAADWNHAGLPPAVSSNPSVPPDQISGNTWTQCGSTISPYGSNGSPGSPSTINNAISSCGSDQYVLLGAGDFYLSGAINLKSNVALRGSGAQQTRVHMQGSNSAFNCNGQAGSVCIVGSNTYGADCNTSLWPCPSGNIGVGYQHEANWTAGYSQGSNTITLDSVSGLVANVTPITLDQCDTGYTGSTSGDACGQSGSAGAITAASVYAGGSGYSVGDTGTISASVTGGMGYGFSASYQVTSVSGGAVTGFTIKSGGWGYTYTNTGSEGPGGGTPTSATSGSGSGFQVNITGINGYDNGSDFISSMGMVSENEGPAGTARSARSQSETVYAIAISGSGPYTVTINHALVNPNWASSQGPKAWWGSSTITNAGVENMTLDQTGITNSASAAVIMSANGVWVYGIASDYANYFHVNELYATNTLIANSYFYYTAYQGTTSYGIGAAGYVGNALYENNIVQGVVDPFNVNAPCSACVFAYNFAVNQADSATNYLFASDPMHSTATNYILEEGNIGAGANLDAIHGPHLFNTFFRNYFNGFEANEGVTTNTITTPITVAAFSRYNNLLGNVLGTPGYATIYTCTPTSATQQYCPAAGGGAETTIFNLGWSHGDQLDYNNKPALPNDLLTASSTYRYGNYDVVNNAVQWNSSEVPTGDASFPNSVPGSNSLPSSFFDGIVGEFANCGTGLPFWKNPTTETCPPYPPIGPDVTNGDIGMCTSGTYKWSRALNASQCAGGSFSFPVSGGYGDSNPAMRCYLDQMGGPPDGTGNFLTFNPASCYANDVNANPVRPAAPTALNGSAVPTS